MFVRKISPAVRSFAATQLRFLVQNGWNRVEVTVAFPPCGVTNVTCTSPSAKSLKSPQTSAGLRRLARFGVPRQHHVPKLNLLDRLGAAVAHQHQRPRREALVMNRDPDIANRVRVQVGDLQVIDRLADQPVRHHFDRAKPAVAQHQEVAGLQVASIHPPATDRARLLGQRYVLCVRAVVQIQPAGDPEGMVARGLHRVAGNGDEVALVLMSQRRKHPLRLPLAGLRVVGPDAVACLHVFDILGVRPRLRGRRQRRAGDNRRR